MKQEQFVMVWEKILIFRANKKKKKISFGLFKTNIKDLLLKVGTHCRSDQLDHPEPLKFPD